MYFRDMRFDIVLYILVGLQGNAQNPFLQRARIAVEVMDQVMDRSLSALSSLEALRKRGSPAEKNTLAWGCAVTRINLDLTSILTEYELSEVMYNLLSATSPEALLKILPTQYSKIHMMAMGLQTIVVVLPYDPESFVPLAQTFRMLIIDWVRLGTELLALEQEIKDSIRPLKEGVFKVRSVLTLHQLENLTEKTSSRVEGMRAYSFPLSQQSMIRPIMSRLKTIDDRAMELAEIEPMMRKVPDVKPALYRDLFGLLTVAVRALVRMLQDLEGAIPTAPVGGLGYLALERRMLEALTDDWVVNLYEMESVCTENGIATDSNDDIAIEQIRAALIDFAASVISD